MTRSLAYSAAVALLLREGDYWYSRDVMFGDYATERFDSVVWC